MSDLRRYRVEWTGPKTPICVPSDDGYWTPWHIAAKRERDLREALDSIRNTPPSELPTIVDYEWWHTLVSDMTKQAQEALAATEQEEQ